MEEALDLSSDRLLNKIIRSCPCLRPSNFIQVSQRPQTCYMETSLSFFKHHYKIRWTQQITKRNFNVLLFIVTSMQGIYNYAIETNNVSSVHNVVAMLWLPFMVHVMLFPRIRV